ncbi:hypothetical protein SNEBB_006207 [Seison nebaliae]|nr:hypothetical protein SNEBB_006207 [Seison nebaliae]
MESEKYYKLLEKAPKSKKDLEDGIRNDWVTLPFSFYFTSFLIVFVVVLGHILIYYGYSPIPYPGVLYKERPIRGFY